MKVIFSILILLAALSSVSALSEQLGEMPGDNEQTRAALLAADESTEAQFCPKCLEEIAQGDHPSISPNDRYQIVNAAGGTPTSGDQGTN